MNLPETTKVILDLTVEMGKPEYPNKNSVQWLNKIAIDKAKKKNGGRWLVLYSILMNDEYTVYLKSAI